MPPRTRARSVVSCRPCESIDATLCGSVPFHPLPRLAATGGCGGPAAAREERPAACGWRSRLTPTGTSRNTKYPVERVIEDAARLGFDGVEILHRQMDGESPEYVQPAETGRVPRRSRDADAVDPPGLRVARPEGAADRHRSHQTVHRAGGAARHPGGAPQLRPLEDDQVVRRPDEGQGRGAAPAGLHAATMRSAGASRASAPACPTPSGTAWCSRSKTTGASPPTSSTCSTSTSAVNSPWLGINLDTGNFPGRPVRRHRTAGAARHHRAGEDVLRRRRVVHARPRLPAHRRDPAEGRLQRLGIARDGRQGAAGHGGAQEPGRAPRGLRAEPDERLLPPDRCPRFCSSSHVFSGAK